MIVSHSSSIKPEKLPRFIKNDMSQFLSTQNDDQIKNSIKQVQTLGKEPCPAYLEILFDIDDEPDNSQNIPKSCFAKMKELEDQNLISKR